MFAETKCNEEKQMETKQLYSLTRKEYQIEMYMSKEGKYY